MALLDRFRAPATEAGEPSVPLAEHAAVANELELAQESLAGLEQLAREDIGWRKLGMEQAQQFTRAGLITIHAACLAAFTKSPLIGRGLRIRRNYVWGSGVEIAAREATDGDTSGVNDLVQAFIDSPEYQRTLGSAQAREERETDLGTKGEFFILAVHDTTASTVRPRLIPAAQITDYIANPDDVTDVWFYKREWTTNRVELATGKRQTLRQVEWHPVLDYRPDVGKRITAIAGAQVRWDAPIQHCAVNSYTDAPWGIPDSYAAIDWARAYADFLTQWSVLMRALSRYAWRTTAPGARAAKVRQSLANGAGSDPLTGAAPVGGHAVMTADATLEAIPKSGATIDAGSGKPLAGMVAAALDVPITMLLGDPGVTGAQAVATTLDRPTEDSARARQSVWVDWIKALLAHVIAVAQEDGELSLPAGEKPTIDVSFPPVEQESVATKLQALTLAEGLPIPPLLIVRLALEALGVEDIDEVLEEMTDENGQLIDPRVNAAVQAVQREQNGQPGSQAAEAYR